MSQTTCPQCGSLAMPGAPFCMTCFVPFDDEPVRAAARVGVPAPALVSVGAPPPAADFFGGPEPGHPSSFAPGMPPLDLPPGMTHTTPAPKQRALVQGLRAIAMLAVVGLLVGGWYTITSVNASSNPKSAIAKAFRDGHPASFLPAFPDFSSGGGDSSKPEAPGAAAQWVRALDPHLRAANDQLLAFQGLLSRWAKKKATDADVRAGIETTKTALKPFGLNLQSLEAPNSTRRGLAKLESASGDYVVALDALSDWLDSRQASSKFTYTFSVGSANVHWDEGVLALYRAANLPAPPLPHPARHD